MITRPKDKAAELITWCAQHKIDLKCQSFIETTGFSANKTFQKTDWIFFNSSRAFNHFLANYTITSQKIAVHGASTAHAVITKGYQPHFIGTGSPQEIGAQFNAKITQNETVLFPVSQRSKLSIARCLPANQVKKIVVYKTKLRKVRLAKQYDYIVFTSPSNFDGYMLENEIKNETKIIVLGETTAQHIREKINSSLAIFKTKHPNQEEIIRVLEKNNLFF